MFAAFWRLLIERLVRELVEDGVMGRDDIMALGGRTDPPAVDCLCMRWLAPEAYVSPLQWQSWQGLYALVDLGAGYCRPPG